MSSLHQGDEFSICTHHYSLGNDSVCGEGVHGNLGGGGGGVCTAHTAQW